MNVTFLNVWALVFVKPLFYGKEVFLPLQLAGDCSVHPERGFLSPVWGLSLSRRLL